jgi:uncharacterized protein
MRLPFFKPVDALDLLIIQPTPFCNINCSYCYLPDRMNKAKIDAATIGKIAERVAESGLFQKHLTVVFHAGEPMVLPPGWYHDFFSIFEKHLGQHQHKLTYSFQTNGTLINEGWCELIKQYPVSIGLSIDGPEFIHDARRKTRNGKGTFSQVMRGAELLRKNGIRFHCIAVIGENSLNHAKEIFDFFYNSGCFSLGLNMEEQEGTNQNSTLNQNGIEERITAFYRVMFDNYMKSDKHMTIREFMTSFGSILRNPETIDITKTKVSTHQTVPFGIITIDYHGNFSTYSPELLGQPVPEYNNFILGNVHQSGFIEPENKVLFDRLKKEIASGIEHCKNECSFFAICGGGAPANKYYENKSFESTLTQYCRNHIQIPAEMMLAFMETSLGINKTYHLD